MQKTIKKLFRQNETYVFLILLALSFLIQARSGQFYTSNNIVDIASAMIVPGARVFDGVCDHKAVP